MNGKILRVDVSVPVDGELTFVTMVVAPDGKVLGCETQIVPDVLTLPYEEISKRIVYPALSSLTARLK